MKFNIPRPDYMLHLNREKFRRICPAHLAETDWCDPRLAESNAAIARAMRWAPALVDGILPETGLLLTGPTGRGKSRMLWYVLSRVMCDFGIDAAENSSTGFASYLRGHARYGDDSGAFSAIERIAKIPVLAIDDLGQEADREGQFGAWLLALLDARMAVKLPLLITTNLTSEALLEHYGKMRGTAILRRLLEMCAVIKF